MYLSELTPNSMYSKPVSMIHSRTRRLTNRSQPEVKEPMFQAVTKKVPEGWPRKMVQASCEFFYLFMETSSIHGFNHLTTRKRSIWEYIIWLAFLIMGTAGAISISLSTWNRYQENPTVISLERDSTEWNTTFPSTTICPYNKFSPPAVKKFAQSTAPDSQDKMKDFLARLFNATYHSFGQVPDDPSGKVPPSEYVAVTYDNRYIFQYKVVDSVDGAPSSVIDHQTEMGLCYSYNSAIAVYNSPLVWLKKKPVRKDVRIISGNNLDGDLFSQIMEMNSPVTVYIHDSWEIPDCATRKLFLPDLKYKTLDMSALSVTISEETMKLSVRQRKCRLFEESNLELSPVYSYNLCRMECRMKQALKLCKCVPYFYKPLQTLIRLQEPNSNDEKQIDCQCLPSCEAVNYVIEMQSDMPWFLGTNFKWSLTRYPLMRLKRDVLFGFTDVLVSIGGTAGLFLGCSILSFMEIFYFFTLRLFFHIIGWKKK
ncbi:pickpocket protein 11 isoform X2 [Anabrus simplex]|uniref:pickpocket protein 11 isoform X2 n=1 Tax=Anabrus simplex TaxID=316456 RepID=UPI0035A3C29B